MCCYKDYKNFERFNNLVQLMLHRAVGFIESMPRDCHSSSDSSSFSSSINQLFDDTPLKESIAISVASGDEYKKS